MENKDRIYLEGDPQEDGELDEEMFCSKCGIALDSFKV